MRLRRIVVAMVLLFSGSVSVFPFSMGYHFDIIREALTREGFDERTIELAQAANAYDDIFATDQSYMLIDVDVRFEIKDLADRLHFDQLMSYDHLKKNTEILIQNTARSIEASRQKLPGDPTAYREIIMTMGITMHILQDFYAHSNWADMDIPAASQISDATLFDLLGQPTGAQTINSAIETYKQRGFAKTGRGMFSHYSDQKAPVLQHSDLFKDYASRAYFDDSYKQAFKATLQWARWIKSMIPDPIVWNQVKNYQWNPGDDDLWDFTTGDNDHGTVRYMCLYGGAWKHWARWDKSEVLFHNLENVTGINTWNTPEYYIPVNITVYKPFLYDEWKYSALSICHGIFEDQLDNAKVYDSVQMVDSADQTTIVSLQNQTFSFTLPYQLKNIIFSELPETDDSLVTSAIATMTSSSTLADYSDINWLKLAIPAICDNDDGGGSWYSSWANVNDEEPLSSSDYYVEWRLEQDGRYIDYTESIYRDQSEPFTNCQVLKPCWKTGTPVKVRVLLRESDKVDLLKQALDNIGLGWLGGSADEGMDITPDDGDDLWFSVDPKTMALLDLPAKCGNVEKPYGRMIKSVGRDGSTFWDFSATVYLQAGTKQVPTTKVRVSVLDIYNDFYQVQPNPYIVPQVKWGARATINRLQLADRDYSCTSTDPNSTLARVNANEYTAESQPALELTYEGYFNDPTFPIRLNFSGISAFGNLSTPLSFGGDYNLTYNFADKSIVDSKHKISGHAGDVFVFEKISNGKVEYRVRARITVEEGTTVIPAPPEQAVEYFCRDASAPEDQHIKPCLRIVNKSANTIPLSDFTVRYWYTSEGYQSESFAIDWSPLSAGSITGRFVKSKPREGADGYVEIGFTGAAGSLPAMGNISDLQLRFNKNDWSIYRESGDYSYDPTMLTWTPNPLITLYRNGSLIYGNEPELIPDDHLPKPDLAVFARDEALQEGNIVKPRLYVQNNGQYTVPRFELRYHFTVENGKTPVLEDYYTPQAEVSLVNAGNGKYYIRYYFECPNFGSGVIVPDAAGCVVGVRYTDWSAFNKSNDYSNPGTSVFTKNDRIEILFPQPPEPVTPTQQTPLTGAAVYIRDEGLGESNCVKPRIYVRNTGAATVTGFDLLYSFTVENGKTPVLEPWYLPNATSSLEDKGNGNYQARLRFTNLSLAPGAVFPNTDGCVFGIHYSDWSVFDKSNDYSNPGSGSWAQTSKVDIVH